MEELEEARYKQILKLAKEGDELSESAAYVEALDKYREALDLIPEPKKEYMSTTWLLAAMGDAHFQSKDFKAGVDNLEYAMQCPEGIDNPFLHMRLGQCQFEVGNFERAADEFTRAYGAGGYEVFELEDPKYYDWLKTQIEIE